MREPLEEQGHRESMPRLTPVDDRTSLAVRAQYEENPYPRWVELSATSEVMTIDERLRRQFPSIPFDLLGKASGMDVLVAGCGTGRNAIDMMRTYREPNVLAIDLSLASLAYAKRKTPAAFARNIEYAQADILKLGTIGRSFDLIDASGVLHHMADPFEAWRVLLSLLRRGGFMHVGLYSELARADVVAARAVIAERGYAAMPEGIRQCRQDLMATPLKPLANFHDFFSTSECLDLLFHVQETRLRIPAIKAFLPAHGLRFIGFEFVPALQRQFHTLFSERGWSLTDLDRWHAFE